MTLITAIIPTYNEENYIQKCISALQKNAHNDGDIELVVIDAGSRDDTVKKVPNQAKLFQRPEFAGYKFKSLNFGAEVASGDYLLFLDADTEVPVQFDRLIASALSMEKVVGGAFEFRFKERNMLLRFIEVCNHIRYRVRQSYYGDQGVFVKKSAFKKVGGFPPVRIMETAYLCGQLRRIGRLQLIKSAIITSGRRFIEGGILPVFVFDLKIWLLNWLGFDVQKYADRYWS